MALQISSHRTPWLVLQNRCGMETPKPRFTSFILNVNSASDQFIRLINAPASSVSPGTDSRARTGDNNKKRPLSAPQPCGARQIFALAYYLTPTGNWTRPCLRPQTQTAPAHKKIARAAGISIWDTLRIVSGVSQSVWVTRNAAPCGCNGKGLFSRLDEAVALKFKWSRANEN